MNAEKQRQQGKSHGTLDRKNMGNKVRQSSNNKN